MSHPPVSQSVARLRAWLTANREDRPRIAAEAGVDEKTLRLAEGNDWNPTIKTIGKLEAVMPTDWQPEAPAAQQDAA